MKLSTAIRTLDNQAHWLGITGQQLLEDIGINRQDYPGIVQEAFAVYSEYLLLEEEVCRLEAIKGGC